MSANLFDLPEPDADAVRRTVEQPGNWHGRATSLVAATVPKGWTGTGEDVRLHLLRSGLPEPHNPNAWGSMIGHCVRAGTLIPTNETRPMKVRRSHGRRTPVYRRA